MNHTLFLNTLIVFVVALAGYTLKDPLILLGLFFLQPFPFEIVANEQRIRAAAVGVGSDDDEEDEPCIGFTAKLK